MWRMGMAAAMVGLLLVGCNFHVSGPSNNPALNRVAEENFRDLAREEDDRVLARMSSANSRETVKAALPTLREIIGPTIPGSAVRTEGQIIKVTDGTVYVVVQTFSLSDRYAYVTTRFIPENRVWKIQGCHINIERKAPASVTPPSEGATET